MPAEPPGRAILAWENLFGRASSGRDKLRLVLRTRQRARSKPWVGAPYSKLASRPESVRAAKVELGPTDSEAFLNAAAPPLGT